MDPIALEQHGVAVEYHGPGRQVSPSVAPVLILVFLGHIVLEPPSYALIPLLGVHVEEVKAVEAELFPVILVVRPPVDPRGQDGHPALDQVPERLGVPLDVARAPLPPLFLVVQGLLGHFARQQVGTVPVRIEQGDLQPQRPPRRVVRVLSDRQDRIRIRDRVQVVRPAGYLQLAGRVRERRVGEVHDDERIDPFERDDVGSFLVVSDGRDGLARLAQVRSAPRLLQQAAPPLLLVASCGDCGDGFSRLRHLQNCDGVVRTPNSLPTAPPRPLPVPRLVVDLLPLLVDASPPRRHRRRHPQVILPKVHAVLIDHGAGDLADSNGLGCRGHRSTGIFPAGETVRVDERALDVLELRVGVVPGRRQQQDVVPHVQVCRPRVGNEGGGRLGLKDAETTVVVLHRGVLGNVEARHLRQPSQYAPAGPPVVSGRIELPGLEDGQLDDVLAR
mmetsp:Transcript_45388/g.84049  ORF Transcript_45388/g.84049 Transcript_45388/m.84049 type:complete len:446 (-) Transcript_45388:703-2040(-)